ncbi:MAG: citrate/2-methylcitrate synthase [Zavarzinella sp.]
MNHNEEKPAYSPGLEGIIAGETAISTLEGGLQYRGYPVQELAEHCSFDQVAYLLLNGELPTEKELETFQSRVAMARRLPNPLKDLLQALPNWTPPLDALRTSVSVMAHFDQDLEETDHSGNMRKAERLYAQLPVAVADYFRFHRGQAAIFALTELPHSANFLYMLTGEMAPPEHVKAFDVSMILYAEHEFNASTFAARTIVSTESDLHSAVCGAIGALKGRLHGGANEHVMPILQEIATLDNAEKWVKEKLAKKERIMGFGHRVYKQGDVRAGILKKYAHEAAVATGNLQWEEIAEVVERVMAEEKNMYPNLDWPAGRLYHTLGLDVSIYTPLFALARVVGWCAHAIEQLEHNRLIRPRSLYTGPTTRQVPLAGE